MWPSARGAWAQVVSPAETWGPACGQRDRRSGYWFPSLSPPAAGEDHREGPGLVGNKS